MRLELRGDFFTAHWRRAPVLLPGLGARLASAHGLDYPSLRHYITAHGETRGDGRTIWFLERLRDAPQWVRELNSAATELFEWEDVWCDLFVTAGPSSIGRHFDDSDNFTIQLAGTKIWRLQAPDSVPADWRRRRALGEPGIGGLPGTPTASDQIFSVGPGDVLYIPSMWQHEGRSSGDSASVSLVVNTATPFHALHRAVEHALRHRASWTAPLETGPGSTDRRTRQLAQALTPETFADLRAALLAEAAAFPALGRHSPRQAPPPVVIDTDHLRDYLASSPQVPENDLVPLTPRTASVFMRLVARRNARRLARLLVTRAGETTDDRPRALYAAVAAQLGRLDPEQADLLLTDPDLTSWIAAAPSGGQERLPKPRAEDPDADILAMAVLPELLQFHEGPPLTIRPVPDIDGGLTLRRLGLRLAPGTTNTENARLVLHQGELTYHDGRIDVALGVGQEAPPFEPLRVLSPAGPVVCAAASQWFADQAPWGTSVHPAAADEPAGLNDVLSAAMALLTRCDPPAAEVHRTAIRVILPLPSIGGRVTASSLPKFRGLIATSSGKPWAVAQALARETAHNHMNGVLEIASLCTNPTTRVTGPLADARLPLSAFFKAAVTSSQEIHTSRGLADEVPGEAPEIEEHLKDRVAEARAHLAVLKEHADLTSLGKAVVSDIEGNIAHAHP